MLTAVFPAFGRPLQTIILRRWSCRLLAILNVKLDAYGTLPERRAQGSLMVANHVSWLDIFAVNALCPSGFVAKSEVRDWPIIGILCRGARTIFIARNDRRDTLRTNRTITERIDRGECVALFPEGTSTDGWEVGHFHSSLLQGAIDANCPVLPVAIRYHDGYGNIRYDAAFIGDMTFVQSLRNILFCNQLHVTLSFLPTLSCTGRNRRQLAAEANVLVSQALHPPATGVHLPARGIPTLSPANNHLSAQPEPSIPAFRSVFSLLVSPLISKSDK